MPTGDVNYVEQDSPGYIAQRIATRSGYINSRLRKRYGNTGAQSSLPFGRSAPSLLSAGTTPPAVTLTGIPVLGSLQITITITTGGALGVAAFTWTSDGVTFHTGVATAATVALAGTGLTAVFAAGTYATDNVYASATPVPEAVLGWLTTMVTYDTMRKRGANPGDPALTMLVEDLNLANAEIKEAADSKDGLFDLPAFEDSDSAVTTGGPLGCAEQSPYVWTDKQAALGSQEDAQTVGAEVSRFE